MFFHIHVIDLAGKSYTYDVTPSTTISDVKDEVVKDTGLSKNQIHLKHKEGDSLLKDDAGSLDHNEI